PFNRKKYRSAGPPAGLDVASYDRADSPEVLAGYQSGPVWEMMTRDAPVTAAAAAAAPQCVGVRGEFPDPPDLNYFRDTVGVVAWLLDAGGVAVKDPQMLWLWSPGEWRADVCEEGCPNPDRHTVILVSPEDGGRTFWYHTRGMRKYGRPDLSVRGVGPRYQ